MANTPYPHPTPSRSPNLRSRHIRLTRRTQRGPAQQKVVSSHKVRVALDGGIGVQPRQHLVDEVGLAAGANIAKLGDPDGLAAGLGDGLADVVLEIGDGVDDAVAGAAVPVDVEEVDLAAAAFTHELAEPGETLGSGGIGDRGGAELGAAARERLYVGVPAGDGVAGGEAGAAPCDDDVGLVEAHQVAGSGGDGGRGGGRPACGVVVETPEHGDVFEL